MTSINYGSDKFETCDEYYIGGLLAGVCNVTVNPCIDGTIEYMDWNSGYENAVPVPNTITNWTL